MKPEYARTTITVPWELKKRMKKAGQKLNWSAIACEAFEGKLEEMGPIEDITSVEGALERIKNIAAERDQNFEMAFGEGKEAGTHWALNFASPEQLSRIQKLKEKIEDPEEEVHNNFKKQMLTPHGRGLLAKCVGYGLEFGEEFFQGPEGRHNHRGRRRGGRGRGHGRGRGKRRVPGGHWRRGPEGKSEHGPSANEHGGQEKETTLQRWNKEKRIRERMIWRSVLNQRPNHMSFFAGFAEGALEIWDQLKDKLG